MRDRHHTTDVLLEDVRQRSTGGFPCLLLFRRALAAHVLDDALGDNLEQRTQFGGHWQFEAARQYPVAVPNPQVHLVVLFVVIPLAECVQRAQCHGDGSAAVEHLAGLGPAH